jgi:transposase
MAKTYKTYLPDQDLLLPPSLRDWLPESHLVYCVADVVDKLDLSAIESVYEEEDRGQPPYHLPMMTKILVYGYCVGVFSSRRIQKRLAEDELNDANSGTRIMRFRGKHPFEHGAIQISSE